MNWNFPSFSFDTAKGLLQLTCVNWAEPNNGRMLYEVSLQLGETELTKEYFDGWNYINMTLDRYVPMTDDKKWIYIPKEGDHFLINAETLEKITLPNLDLSATSFIGNMFVGDFLIVMGRRQVISKNLQTGSTAVLNKPEGYIDFKDVRINDKNSIAVHFAYDFYSIVSIDTLQPIIP